MGCGRLGEYMCPECQLKLEAPELVCPMCGSASLGGVSHGRCRRGWGIERLVVGLKYRGVVQKCLKRVKYQSAWDILSFLFKVWQDRGGLEEIKLDGQGVLVSSVPMWSSKERERGFNQAEILADLLVSAYPMALQKAQVLVRTRSTLPMFGLKKEERRENVQGAFTIKEGQEKVVVGKHVILVDDVWTTGATMRECARCLMNAGAVRVWGVALAK